MKKKKRQLKRLLVEASLTLLINDLISNEHYEAIIECINKRKGKLI